MSIFVYYGELLRKTLDIIVIVYKLLPATEIYFLSSYNVGGFIASIIILLLMQCFTIFVYYFVLTN